MKKKHNSKNQNNKVVMEHLNTFKERFLSDRYRPINNGIEYHGQDLDIALPNARLIILALGLNLTARTTGDMAQQRRFEVIIKEQE